MPAGTPDGWVSALTMAGALLAILAGIAYAEIRERWPRRAMASLAVVGAVAALTAMFALLV